MTGGCHSPRSQEASLARGGEASRRRFSCRDRTRDRAESHRTRPVPAEPRHGGAQASRPAARGGRLETDPGPAGQEPALHRAHSQVCAVPRPHRRRGLASQNLSAVGLTHVVPPLQISASPGQRSSTCPPSPEQVTTQPRPPAAPVRPRPQHSCALGGQAGRRLGKPGLGGYWILPQPEA